MSDEGLHKTKKPRVSMVADREPVYYHDYLQLDKVLGAQRMLSSSNAKAPAEVKGATACPFHTAAGAAESNEGAAHDEHLFIIIHQTYELWFKQILWELSSVQRAFAETYVREAEVALATSRLHRVCEILRILVDQFTVLETMSPTGFLEFRDHLFPASGFQSVQFRLLENTLGLKRKNRTAYGKGDYCSYLSTEHSSVVGGSEQTASLLALIERWLERSPFLSAGANGKANGNGKSGCPRAAGRGSPAAPLSSLAPAAAGFEPGGSNSPRTVEMFDFWAHYTTAVTRGLEYDREYIRERARARMAEEGSAPPAAAPVESQDSSGSAGSADATAEAALAEVDEREEHFRGLLDSSKYEEMREAGKFTFSHRAMQAALLIHLYHDQEPILGHAFRLLQALTEVDELLTQWRSRHALMVHRMLGVKMGTGGSSGYHYLRTTAAEHRVFKDLFNLSTYLIPKTDLPPLPEAFRKMFSFAAENKS